MQKYFSDKKIPITGCDSYQSELTFDKVKCLNFLSSKGIKVAPSIAISKTNKPDLKEIETKVGFPCFIKASNSGSSFGVYKVYNRDEMVNCLDSAFEVDNKVSATENDIQKILSKYAKQLKDSIEQFKKGNRLDLVVLEDAEFKIVDQFFHNNPNSWPCWSFSNHDSMRIASRVKRPSKAVSYTHLTLPTKA